MRITRPSRGDSPDARRTGFLIPVETVRDGAAGVGVVPQPDSAFTRLWNHGVDLYIRDLHYRAYRNMAAASTIHPGFPDVERVKEDCQIKHAEQGYLHREEVQWGVMGIGFIGAIAGLWFGGRRVSSVARERLRRIIKLEGKVIGAIGVSGDTPQADEAIAIAGASAFS